MQRALMPDAPQMLDDRWGTGARWLKVIGRLGTGVSVEQATASARLVHQRFVAEKADALGEGHPEVAGERKVRRLTADGHDRLCTRARALRPAR